MIKPTINDLTKGKINRYELVIATAKCARMITDEYIARKEEAEQKIANKETDKPLSSLIKLESTEEKSVKAAINRIYEGDFIIDKTEE